MKKNKALLLITLLFPFNVALSDSSAIAEAFGHVLLEVIEEQSDKNNSQSSTGVIDKNSLRVMCENIFNSPIPNKALIGQCVHYNMPMGGVHNPYSNGEIMPQSNFPAVDIGTFGTDIDEIRPGQLAVGPVLSSPSTYIGCYRDQGEPQGTSGRDLDGFHINDSNMTPNQCTSLCKSKGYSYAAVQYGSHCFCGNTYGRLGNANNCDMKCDGDSSQICGGSWANSMYKVN